MTTVREHMTGLAMAHFAAEAMAKRIDVRPWVGRYDSSINVPSWGWLVINSREVTVRMEINASRPLKIVIAVGVPEFAFHSWDAEFDGIREQVEACLSLAGLNGIWGALELSQQKVAA